MPNTLRGTIAMSVSFVVQWRANSTYLANSIDNNLIDFCICHSKTNVRQAQKQLRTCVRVDRLGKFIIYIKTSMAGKS